MTRQRKRVRTMAAATVLVTAATVAVAAPAHAAGPLKNCAWPIEASPDRFNVYFPDSAATYWVQAYDIEDGASITVDGTYPDTRYASLVTYRDIAEGGGYFRAHGADSWITDHRIAPAEGSRNPYVTPGAEPGGRFTVRVTNDARPGDVNAIPFSSETAADGQTGVLIYRVYDAAGPVALPAVTIHDPDGTARTLPRCERPITTPERLPSRVSASVTAREASGFQRVSYASALPNPDNAYLSSDWTPAAGEVMVVRAKAPTHSAPQHPTPWPDEAAQVRYWSLCTMLQDRKLSTVINRDTDGNPVYGCVQDTDVPLDADGIYTAVIGPSSERARVQREFPGTVFVPTSDARPAFEHTVVLRNMVPAGDFAEAVQNVPAGSGPDAAAEVMDDHYPRSGVCAATALYSGGPAACLPGTE